MNRFSESKNKALSGVCRLWLENANLFLSLFLSKNKMPELCGIRYRVVPVGCCRAISLVSGGQIFSCAQALELAASLRRCHPYCVLFTDS